MRNHVLDYLNEIVVKKPDKLAFSNGMEGLTFHEVYLQSRSVATYLHQKEIYKEPVVILMNKHPDEVVAFFGTIAAGDFYVPIDAEMPISRIQLILDNVKSPIIICDEKTLEVARNFEFEGDLVCYNDICQTKEDAAVLREIHEKAIDTDPIYIVFTSGSTGIPKGVCACHRSVIDYIEQLSETLEFDEDTVFGNQTPLYFDACLKELYPTLKFGATTFLIPRNLFLQPIKLVEYLNENEINTICWVVSALTMISAFGAFRTILPKCLRTIAFGSEVFPIKKFNIWKEALPNAKFINLYGPTEGTGMCCFYKVEREFALDEVIPIGHPFKNTEIILLNDENKRVIENEVGEICIRGTSLTLGYYNNWEKTGEVFVQNPLNTVYPELIYRTGDLGKYNEYGELVFVSRKDFQIKHMGHRIELGEIETAINSIDAIDTGVCLYDNDTQRILLFYCGSEDATQAYILKKLRDKVPKYMFPNVMMKLEKMPQTLNGKIDRLALKEYYDKDGKNS